MKSSIYLYIFYDISDKVLQGPQWNQYIPCQS